ncbi:MAG: murein biosynthesis integral membrane protein MurJ [Ilumatobacteraceae bacterium]
MSNEPENTLPATTLPVSDLLDQHDDRSANATARPPAATIQPPAAATNPAQAARSGMLRNNVVVAAGTALSRLTGLIRVYAFARFVGQSAIADAYNSANGSPNAIYELLLGGVLSASLIPMFTKQAEDEDEDATSAVFSVAMIAVTALTLVAVIAAPLVFRLFSVHVDAAANPAIYRAAGTALTRIFLVQIFFYGLTALATSLLNAHRRFFAAAWSPVLANVVIIAGLAIVPHVVDGKPQVGDILTNDKLKWTLALGATVGIAVMAASLVPAMRAAHIRLRFRPDFKHPAISQLTKLSTWTLGYVVFNQIAAITMINLADPGTGHPDAYAKAYILFVLPHGLLAMSIATTFEPEMARNVKRRSRDGLIDVTSLGIRLVALLTFPAGLLMFTLRRPIVGFALQHGNFTAANALDTSRALGGFALGLVGFSVYLFTLRAFYAHGDARTPFVINVVENVINIVLGVALHGTFGVLGLGLSFAIAYLVSAVWALQVLGYKVPGFPVGQVLAALARMGVAALMMAEAAWIVARGVGGNTGWGSVGRILAASVVGIAVYIATLVVVRAPELDQLRRRLRRA